MMRVTREGVHDACVYVCLGSYETWRFLGVSFKGVFDIHN